MSAIKPETSFVKLTARPISRLLSNVSLIKVLGLEILKVKMFLLEKLIQRGAN